MAELLLRANHRIMDESIRATVEPRPAVSTASEGRLTSGRARTVAESTLMEEAEAAEKTMELESDESSSEEEELML